MFGSFLAVPLHFTIEFLGFLVAAGGALLVWSRPTLVPGPISNRVSVALGLAVYSAAQLLHGASFYPADGAPELFGLRALAFALMLIGVVGGLRPGAAAITAFQVREPLAFAPAGAALLVSLAALSAAGRTGTAYRRLAVATFFLALSEAFISAAPGASFGTGSLNEFAYYAHAAKVLGFLALGAWLWSAVRSSIRVRFVASFGALLVAVILALSTALTGVISNNVENGGLATLEGQAANAVSTLNEEARELTRNARLLAGFPEIIDGFQGQEPGALANRIFDLELFDLDFVIVDPRSDLPGAAGHGPDLERGSSRTARLGQDDVLKITGNGLVKEVRSGRAASAGSPARVGRSVAILGASNVIGDAGGSAGVLVVGRFLDVTKLDGLASAAQAKGTLLIDSGFAADGQSRMIATTLGEAPAREFEVPPEIEVELVRSGRASREIGLGNAVYFNGFASLVDGQSNPVATLVFSSRSTIVDATRQGVTKILFLSAMLVGAIALFLAYLSGRRITRPIQMLTDTAKQVREGDLKAQANVEGEDEVGQLGETFNEMTSSLLKMTNDLRDAARQEHDLRERIETIIESMADGLIAVDSDGRVLAFNRQAENLTGMKTSEAMGEPLRDVLKISDGQGEPVELAVYSLGEGSAGNIYLDRPERDPVPVAVTSAALRDEQEQVMGAVAVVRDMTREREIERMKTEFLSNISHELRTPLTPIKGYAEILLRKEVPLEKVRQFSSSILESTGKLERIVQLLVDFSAMEAGRINTRMAPIEMPDMIRSVVVDWRARSTSHELEFDLGTELPRVVGDEKLLVRTLNEVIDNAVKFSPDGGKVKVEARGYEEDAPTAGRFVEITVTDEGIGISEEDLPKIFSDFHQLDGSETRSYGGLGLGLAYVQRIVEAHAGDIQVRSDAEKGTTVVITLPASAEQDPAEASPPVLQE
jgi:PAS domain S-box-containing protein